jgi:hypothetical protein
MGPAQVRRRRPVSPAGSASPDHGKPRVPGDVPHGWPLQSYHGFLLVCGICKWAKGLLRGKHAFLFLFVALFGKLVGRLRGTPRAPEARRKVPISGDRLPRHQVRRTVSTGGLHEDDVFQALDRRYYWHRL